MIEDRAEQLGFVEGPGAANIAANIAAWASWKQNCLGLDGASLCFKRGYWDFGGAEQVVDFLNPGSGPPFDDNRAVSAIRLIGDAPDLTRFNARFKFRKHSQQHSVHLGGFAPVASSAAAGRAITVENDYPFFGTFCAQDSYRDITFRGDDGYSRTKYWSECLHLSNTSNIRAANLNGNGMSDGTVGLGVVIDSPGNGCFAAPCSCGSVFDFTDCNWQFLDRAYTYGLHTQSLRIKGGGTYQCQHMIWAPPNAGTLQALSIAYHEMYCLADAVLIESELPNADISHCHIAVKATKRGIVLRPKNAAIVAHNQFDPYDLNAPNSALCAIDVDGPNGILIVDGNGFAVVTLPVRLLSGCRKAKITNSNHQTGHVTKVQDLAPAGSNTNLWVN